MKTRGEESWLVVLRRDGVVADVGGGAPRAWIGRAFRECDEAERVKEAAARLLERPTSDAWCKRAFCHVGEREVELLRIEAVPLRRETTSLFELLARTVETLMAQAHAGEVDLKLEVDPLMPPSLFLDGEKLAWGVASLVGSALRHVGDSPSKKPAIRVSARVSEAGNEVVVSVVDNGPGIPREKLRSLLRRDAGGRRAGGLALVLLEDVVVAHGGRVEIESSTAERDHGTTVRIMLPIFLGST